MAVRTSERTLLGCGRDIDDVWAGIDDPPDAHELTCPYCQSARHDLAALAEATRELNTRDEDDPALQTPPAVLEHILDVARAEVRRGRRLPLEVATEGADPASTVSEQAVGTLVRRVADESSQIQVWRCAVRVAGASTGESRSDDEGAVAIALRVSTRSDVVIPAVVAELRTALAHAVEAEVGLRVISVDVAVEDLHDV